MVDPVLPGAMGRYLVIYYPRADEQCVALTCDDEEKLQKVLVEIGMDGEGSGCWLVAAYDLDERRNLGVTLRRLVKVEMEPGSVLDDSELA